mmetsp:Transcript_42926/g.99422  ORF Transcript_42926/g.99422 Transcript_42926/m.99422 type:complete len:225 (-) Transcript_42926:656-1330(-)
MFAVSFSIAFSCTNKMGLSSFARMPRNSSSPTFRSGSTFMRLGAVAANVKVSGCLPLARGPARCPRMSASAGMPSLRRSCVERRAIFAGSGLPALLRMMVPASLPNLTMASGASSWPVSFRTSSDTRPGSRRLGPDGVGAMYSRNSVTALGREICRLTLANNPKTSGMLSFEGGEPLSAMSSEMAGGPPSWSLILTMSPLKCKNTCFISAGLSKMWLLETLLMM